MDTVRSERQAVEAIDRRCRKAWTKPTIARLLAGAAESRPGARIFDNTLEAVGS